MSRNSEAIEGQRGAELPLGLVVWELSPHYGKGVDHSLLRSCIDHRTILRMVAHVQDDFFKRIPRLPRLRVSQHPHVSYKAQQLAGSGKSHVQASSVAQKTQPAFRVRPNRGIDHDVAVASLKRVDRRDLDLERTP